MRIFIISSLLLLSCNKAPTFTHKDKSRPSIEDNPFIPRFPVCEENGASIDTLLVGCFQGCVPPDNLKVVCPLDDTPFGLTIKSVGKGVLIQRDLLVRIPAKSELYYDFVDKLGNRRVQLLQTVADFDSSSGSELISFVNKGQEIRYIGGAYPVQVNEIVHWYDDTARKYLIRVVEPVTLPTYAKTLDKE